MLKRHNQTGFVRSEKYCFKLIMILLEKGGGCFTLHG